MRRVEAALPSRSPVAAAHVQTLRVIVQFVLAIALPLLVQLWDRRRLTAAQRARGWNATTWACAVYAFGEFSMLGWYWVTRRWRGIPYAIVASLTLFVTVRWLVDLAVVRLLGIDAEIASLGELVAAYVVVVVAFSGIWAIALASEAIANRRRPRL